MTTNNTITQQQLQSFSDYKVLSYCMDNGDCFPTMIYANDCIFSMNSIGQWILKFNHKALLV